MQILNKDQQVKLFIPFIAAFLQPYKKLPYCLHICIILFAHSFAKLKSPMQINSYITPFISELNLLSFDITPVVYLASTVCCIGFFRLRSRRWSINK